MSDQEMSDDASQAEPGRNGQPYSSNGAQPAASSWADEATMAMPISELLAEDPDDEL
jgi:hypothetical protein